MENYELKLENFKKGFQQTFKPDDAYSERFETNLGRLFDILNSEKYKNDVKNQDDYVYFGDFNPDTVKDFLNVEKDADTDTIKGIDNPDIGYWSEVDGLLLFTDQKHILYLLDENFQEAIFTTLVEPYLLDHPDRQSWFDRIDCDWCFQIVLFEVWNERDIESRYHGMHDTWDEVLKTDFCKALKNYKEAENKYLDLKYWYY